ncbi:branched-chain amino acid ABC transporter permease [Phosphitispora sp. TUW77]|uniref:branched-chain amino acid ABC transporter permease n=1 Tax=Phosphitispora sp. TUW77 TaxID=3152361 RepID=UPI003AB3A754
MKDLLKQKRLRHALIFLFTMIIFAIPFLVTNNYYLSVLVIIGIHTIVVVGLCLLMGYAGQISLGHAAFYGLGAYTSGILTATYNISPWLAMLAGIIVTGITAYLIGIPIFRLKEHYLALATLGFGLIIHVILMEEVALTGGPSGLSKSIPYLSMGSLVFNNDFKFYFLVWILVLLALILANNVVHSRIGRALKSIHGSEFAARSLGVDTSKYKLQVFTLSAIYASVAGSLYAHYITFISPSPFGLMTSVQFMVMAVVGGLASIWGPIFGVSVITIMAESLKEFMPVLIPQAGGEYEIVVYGIILVVIMIFMPDGLTATLVKLYEGWRYRKEHPNETS